MDSEKKENKKFLTKQIEWCIKRDSILEEIEKKLHEMKNIVEYTPHHKSTSMEVDQLNEKLNELKKEVQDLEIQLNAIVH